MTAQQLQQQSGKGQPLQSHMDHTRTMRGTAAFVLEGTDTTHRVSAVLEVPGQPKDQSAYHSELADHRNDHNYLQHKQHHGRKH